MKEAIRKEILAKRRHLVSAEISDRSKKIHLNLAKLEEYENAGTIALYLSFDNEVDTFDLVRGLMPKKKLLVPKMVEDQIELHELGGIEELKMNRYGILEPQGNSPFPDYKDIDLILVPGVAFDRDGNRIGFGRGDYDRLLKKMTAPKIALAYDFQVLDKIPAKEHDHPVDILVTESEIIYSKPRILDGKRIADKITAALKEKISSLEKKPCLAVIMVGDDPASYSYVRIKKKKCEELRITSKIYPLDKDSTEEKILLLIKHLNNNPDINGILLQIPIPDHFDQKKIINAVAPEKDVDCLTTSNLGRFYDGRGHLEHCTPKGIIRLLEESGVSIGGKHAVVIGRSDIVGKPVASLLLKKDATVTICHSKTKNLEDITKTADILVVAAGRPKLVTEDMVKHGAIVIDVGTNRIGNKLEGDVDFEKVKRVCSLITPVPGGIGPMTVAMLMENTLICYENQVGLDGQDEHDEYDEHGDSYKHNSHEGEDMHNDQDKHGS